jgi:hypothetical protein
MSQEELVEAYLAGGINRRVFIRRLVAAGVGLGAAVSYAHLLAPRASADRVLAHGYEPPNPPVLSGLQMVPEDLDRVIRKKRFKVRGTSNQPATYWVNLHLYRPADKTEWPDAVIGYGPLTFDAAGERTFEIAIAPTWHGATRNHALDALKKQKRRARVGVHPFEGDVDPVSANAIVYKR